MAQHLRFDMIGAYKSGVTGHPQKVMEELGITYQHAPPQSISDQWWFWNCENIQDPLPVYIETADWDPMKYIGWGLSEDEAVDIRDYQSEG